MLYYNYLFTTLVGLVGVYLAKNIIDSPYMFKAN
jgi:hypothetical protein